MRIVDLQDTTEIKETFLKKAREGHNFSLEEMMTNPFFCDPKNGLVDFAKSSMRAILASKKNKPLRVMKQMNHIFISKELSCNAFDIYNISKILMDACDTSGCFEKFINIYQEITMSTTLRTGFLSAFIDAKACPDAFYSTALWLIAGAASFDMARKKNDSVHLVKKILSSPDHMSRISKVSWNNNAIDLVTFMTNATKTISDLNFCDELAHIARLVSSGMILVINHRTDLVEIIGSGLNDCARHGKFMSIEGVKSAFVAMKWWPMISGSTAFFDAILASTENGGDSVESNMYRKESMLYFLNIRSDDYLRVALNRLDQFPRNGDEFVMPVAKQIKPRNISSEMTLDCLKALCKMKVRMSNHDQYIKKAIYNVLNFKDFFDKDVVELASQMKNSMKKHK